MAFEISSVPRIPSSAPDFIDIERFFTREKAKPRTLYVCLYCTAKPWKDGYKGNARRHMRNNHPYLTGLSSQQNQSQQSLDVYITSSTTPSEAALRNAFNRQAYIEALISLLTRRRVGFSMMEWDELKDLALKCNPAIEDSLITSQRTVMRYIAASYEFYAAQLAESLQSANSMIHLSSDLWTSPHRHGMLAVCGQRVDKGYKLRKALLGLLECRKGHSGESQAGLIADVLERFEIRRVGYHTGDNASSNNACLEALLKKLLHGRGIVFDPVRRRVCCFDHIINLSLQTFLLARSKETLRTAINDAGNDAGAQSIETFSTALNQNTPSGPDTTVDHTSG
ncbi:putative AC transposase [Fusarium oxysporum f. sp. rapae]|nr:putative AC transposase [Fusarium oxysporum f. sp. rapae]